MALKQYKSMICLVGENPLPIYIGIRKLSAPDAKIWLICSDKGTDFQAKAINTLVELDNCRREECRKCELIPISDPYNPNIIRTVISGFSPDGSAALNITGGTKVMSAFAATAWRGASDDIFYVEDGRRKFHFASGNTEDIGDLDLTLDDLGKLHGIEIIDDYYALSIPPLKEIMGYYDAIKSENRAVRSRYHFSYSSNRINEDATFSCNMEHFRNCFALVSKETKKEWGMPEALPASIGDYKLLEWKPVFDFFAKSQWFECMIYLLVLDIIREEDGEFPLHEIAFRRKCVRSEYLENQRIDSQIFEGDIFLVFRNRLRFISVTTSPYARICKAKMFEAMHRAKQIGGDMATSCVVCLANDMVLNSCRVSIAKYPRHAFFGRSDVKRWMKGETESLRRFLTQDFVMNEVSRES